MHQAEKVGVKDDAENQEPDEQTRKQVEHWNTRVINARKTPQFKEYLDNIKKHRRYVRGRVGTDDDDEVVRTNLIYATMASQLPRIYAKNPEIAITPSEAVDQHFYKLVKAFAQTLEIALNKMLDRAKLKKRAKASVRSSMTTSLGWLKVIYQRDIKTDPHIQSRMNDVQDNLRRLNYLIEQCENEQELQGHEIKRAELAQQLQALAKKVEIVTAEGLVMDRVLSEDMVWDQDVRDYDSYTDCRWMGHRIWYTASSYEETFDHKVPKGVSVYKSGTAEQNENISTDSEEARFAVWEIWDRVSNTIYTWAEGACRWARDPYQPERVGEQWFPFFPLGFHIVDGQFIPLSTVGLLKGLQDEYNNTREDYVAVRKYNKPHYIADIDTKEQDVQKKTVAEIGEIILVDSNGRPLNEVFQQAPNLRIDPQQYDTSQIRSDFEFMSGLGDAARGSVAKAKTATEAEILESGLAGRSNEMQDAIEDWMEDIAKYCSEIILQEMTTEQITRLVGPGAVWPQMDKREIFDLVNVEIRAGTSGKPNKLQEQKQWLEFLPQLRELFMKVSELRKNGDAETAAKLVTIARETIRRLDERIDVEEFLPQEEGMNERDMQAMQEQLDAANREIKKLEAEIRNINSQTVKNLADAGEKVAQSFINTDMMPPADQLLPAPMQASPTPSAGDTYGTP